MEVLHELELNRKKLGEADLVSYLALAYWIYHREESKNELGLNLSLVRPFVSDDYRAILLTNIIKEQAKKVRWDIMKGAVRANIEFIYSSFKGIKKQDLNKKSKEWFDNYANQLVAEISNLPYNGETTILDYTRRGVLSFIDEYVKKADEKKELEFLNKLINDAITHNFS